MLKRKIQKNGHASRARTPSQLREEPVPYLTNGDSRKVVSLFSGAMGLDLGLMEAGLQIAVAQDSDAWCVETIRRNSRHSVVPGDIRQLIQRNSNH